MKKFQSGITTISLAIAVVIIIIIASFSVFNSKDLIYEGNVAKIYTEMGDMKDAVRKLSLDNDFNDTIIGSYKISNISTYQSRVDNKLVEGRDYYYIGFGDSSISNDVKQELNRVLDIRSVSNSYIVCFGSQGQNVELYLVDGIRSNNGYYYTYDEVANAYSSITKKSK